jgi:iron-sulfur cluster repair protein YtfE (RIC family)
MNVHADTVIEDLVREHPVAVRILREFDIVCIRCGEPYWGTLAELAASKGVTDLDPILTKLNSAIGSAPDDPEGDHRP